MVQKHIILYIPEDVTLKWNNNLLRFVDFPAAGSHQ